jgi:hypothetical protein
MTTQSTKPAFTPIPSTEQQLPSFDDSGMTRDMPLTWGDALEYALVTELLESFLAEGVVFESEDT